MDLNKIWIIIAAVVTGPTSTGETYRVAVENCQNSKCMCKAADSPKRVTKETATTWDEVQENLLRQRRKTVDELLDNFRMVLNNENETAEGVADEVGKRTRHLRARGGHKHQWTRGRYSKHLKNYQDAVSGNNLKEGQGADGTGKEDVLSYEEGRRGGYREGRVRERDRDINSEQMKGDTGKHAGQLGQGKDSNQDYEMDRCQKENALENKSETFNNGNNNDDESKASNKDLPLRKENKHRDQPIHDPDTNCQSSRNPTENIAKSGHYQNVRYLKRPIEFGAGRPEEDKNLYDLPQHLDSEVIDYLAQQHMRFEWATTTQRAPVAATTEEDELAAFKYPVGILRETDVNNYTEAPAKNNQPPNKLGYQEDSNMRQPVNDQFQLTTNNLSHEAQYKLSKVEQEAAEKGNGSFWKWPWPLAKRSLHFNAMNEIKLKTSNRLMRKGFGPSLPSYALGENQRELMIDNMVKRREQKLLRGGRSNSELGSVSERKDDNDLSASDDLEDAAIEPVSSPANANDWHYVRRKRKSNTLRYKRATDEENKVDAIESYVKDKENEESAILQREDNPRSKENGNSTENKVEWDESFPIYDKKSLVGSNTTFKETLREASDKASTKSFTSNQSEIIERAFPVKTGKALYESTTLYHIKMPRRVKSSKALKYENIFKDDLESSKSSSSKLQKSMEIFRAKSQNSVSNNFDKFERDHGLPSTKSCSSSGSAKIGTAYKSHVRKRQKRDLSYANDPYSLDYDNLFKNNNGQDLSPSSFWTKSLNNDWEVPNSGRERLKTETSRPNTNILKSQQYENSNGKLQGNQQVNFNNEWWNHEHKQNPNKSSSPLKSAQNPYDSLNFKDFLSKLNSSGLEKNIQKPQPIKKKKTVAKSQKTPMGYVNARSRTAHTKVTKANRDHVVNHIHSPSDWPNHLYERYPNMKYWLDAITGGNKSLGENTLVLPNNDSNKISLELGNDILNCTAFSSLEEFLKSLPKNTSTTATTTGQPEEIQIDFTTLDISEEATENPLSVTTEEWEESTPSIVTMDPFEFTSPSGPETEELPTTECEDTNENWLTSTEEDQETVSTSSKYTPIDESTPMTETSSDDVSSTMDPLPGMNSDDDVKLNITINANVHGNSKDKNFFGNGTFHVKPGYLDDRIRRQTFQGEMKKRQSVHSSEIRPSYLEDNKDSLLSSGKISADIVKAVLRLVRDSPELKVLWPSLKRNQLDKRPQGINFYAIRNVDNEKQIQQSEQLIGQAMEALNDIIDQQVHNRNCIPLRDDLQDFYNLIIQSNRKKMKNRAKRENAKGKLRPDFYRKVSLIHPNKMEEKSGTVKKLLREYENLPEKEQMEANDLLSPLSHGQNTPATRKRRDKVKNKYLGSFEKDNEVLKLLDKYYTPEVAKSLPALP